MKTNKGEFFDPMIFRLGSFDLSDRYQRMVVVTLLQLADRFKVTEKKITKWESRPYEPIQFRRYI